MEKRELEDYKRFMHTFHMLVVDGMRVACGRGVLMRVGSLSFMLMALFLHFNWFEEKWRRTVLEAREARGINARFSFLLGHISAWPLSLIDLLLIKEPLMAAYYRPPFETIALVGFVYGLTYFAWMHLNHSLSGLWPYPFCDKLFATIPLQAAFVGGVSGAMIACSYAYYSASLALAP